MVNRIHVLVPFWGLAGGVIKVLDYADHASHLAPVTLWSNSPVEADSLVHTLPVMERLFANDDVSFRDMASLTSQEVDAGDLLLFTEPTHIAIIDALDIAPARMVHLVQGTRHANPNWNEGKNFRLLHRPMHRIAVTEQVAEAVAPHIDRQYPSHTVVEGHDVEYFSNPNRPAVRTDRPLRVFYTTWKSDLGDRVARVIRESLDYRHSFEFVPVHTPTGWPALRDHYHRADVFLGAPGPEEGFYLPGLEALASECVLVMALVGGNAAYCEPGVNMIEADYDDQSSHADALRSLITSPSMLTELRSAGKESVKQHTLAREQREVVKILRETAANYDALHATGTGPDA